MPSVGVSTDAASLANPVAARGGGSGTSERAVSVCVVYEKKGTKSKTSEQTGGYVASEVEEEEKQASSTLVQRSHGPSRLADSPF